MVLLQKKNNLLFIGLLLLLSCATNDEAKKNTALNKFNDPIIQQINEHKFNHWRTHLYNSLSYPNPSHRTEALLAFTSLGDNSGFQKVKELLLRDPEPSVRSTAAFSLGKLGGNGAVNILKEGLANEKEDEVKKQILISLAYAIQPDQLSLITDFSTDNTILKEGQLLGLVVAKKRTMTDSKILEVAVNYLTDPTEELNVKILASKLVLIADSSEVVHNESAIRKSLVTETNLEIISSLILGLRKTRNDSNAIPFEHHLKSSEWLVRMNSLYGLSELYGNKNKKNFEASLHDPNVNVVIAASEIIKQKFNQFSVTYLLEEARKQTHWQSKLNLYQAAYELSNDPLILDEVVDYYHRTANDYAKATCIQIISLDISRYKFLSTELFATKSPIIRTNCAKTLTYINLAKDFPVNVKNEFVEIYKKGIELGDPAVVAIFSRILYHPSLDHYKTLNDINFLYTTRKKLETKKEVAALEPLETLVSKIEKRIRGKYVSPEKKKPDWNFIKSIDRNQKILIKTSKGTITVKLLVENSPVAVSNFLQLVTENYYDSTAIFSVGVNSFIQSGCKRGDGYGRLGYNLPYEASVATTYNAPMVYLEPFKDGYESTQWYISLNPVVHNLGIPIGQVVDTDISLLRSFEKGDTILTMALSNE